MAFVLLELATFDHLFPLMNIKVKSYGKLCSQFDATQFELLDDVGDFLETMDVTMISALCVGNDQKGRFFKQKDFVSFHDCGEFGKAFFDL